MASASRRVSGWLALVDRIAPHSIHGDDPVRQRRARLLVFNTLGFIASGIAQCLLAFTIEPPERTVAAALPFVLGSALGVGAILYLRWRGKSELAARMTLGGAFVVTVIASYSEGGLASPGLAWFVVMPVVASALIGSRAAVFIAAASIIVVLVFALLQTYELPVPPPPTGDAYAIKRTFQVCSAVLLCAGLVYMNGVFEEETQQALVETRDAATQASLAKSRFVANVSHEIRTPMTAILGYTDVLAEPGLDEKERQEAIETLRRNGHQLLALINDMLDLSRIEADGLELRNREVSPVSVVQQVVALLRDRARVRRLSLQLELTSDLPALIWTDAVRLQQVLVNLLGNAIKFTEQGGIRVVVSLEAVNAEPRLRFDVIDSGIGIAEADRERIFEPFSQADATESRRYGGTGLGLAISRRLAQKLGGDLALASEEGRGSTFSLLLPIREPSAEDRDADTSSGAVRDREARTAQGAPAAPPLLRGRVLVAEDGLDNQRLIARVLGRAGLDISLAPNGRKAVDDVLAAELAGTPFDLVLMDMQMPELDGYAATQALRDSGFTRPIIALSAHAMREDQERCIAAGCDAFAPKPIDRVQLLALLAQYLQKSTSD
jgi:signal transduction histidine kinase/CheY-like chemotaxis protein